MDHFLYYFNIFVNNLSELFLLQLFILIKINEFSIYLLKYLKYYAVFKLYLKFKM